MTVLLAWTDKTGAYLAADSGLVGGAVVPATRVWAPEEKLRPVSVLAETAIVGAAGNAAAGPLGWYCEPPRPPRRTRGHDYEIALDRWAFDLAVDLERTARELDLVCDTDDGHGLVDAAWLIGFRGRAWLLSQRSARRVDGYAAVGTGGAYAAGALAALAPQVDSGAITVHDALVDAVVIACDHDAYCRGPAQVEFVPAS